MMKTRKAANPAKPGEKDERPSGVVVDWASLLPKVPISAITAYDGEGADRRALPINQNQILVKINAQVRLPEDSHAKLETFCRCFMLDWVFSMTRMACKANVNNPDFVSRPTNAFSEVSV